MRTGRGSPVRQLETKRETRRFIRLKASTDCRGPQAHGEGSARMASRRSLHIRRLNIGTLLFDDAVSWLSPSGAEKSSAVVILPARLIGSPCGLVCRPSYRHAKRPSRYAFASM